MSQTRFNLFSLAMAGAVAFPLLSSAVELPEVSALPARPELPPVLATFDGTPVTTADQWTKKRRPELEAMVQKYEYGFLPPAPPSVIAKVLHEDKSAFGGKATLREIELTWPGPAGAIHLLLVNPNARKPAPVFLGLNFTGNHTVVDDPKVKIDPGAIPKQVSRDSAGGEKDRGRHIETWNIEASIDRGYAVATFFNGDVIPDDKEAAENALARFRASPSSERGSSDAGTIAVWAWCLQRAVDYLVTDPVIDGKRIALVGHSRNGKTALLAAALDQRIALVIPSQAGCGGTSPVRVETALSAPQANGRPMVETVAVINRSFPHWFSGNFKFFGESPEKLPYDHHALIALCAPRPVLLSNATEDKWANPAGQFEMLRAADPAYRLIAQDGLSADKMPEEGVLVSSRLGYFIRPGKHSMNKTDWDAWLDYADKWNK